MLGQGRARPPVTSPRARRVLGWVLHVALTFGFTITVLAYTIGHHSGGQINCAVTLGLVLTGLKPVAQAAWNVLAQLFGSVVGAGLLAMTVNKSADLTGNLASNRVGDDYRVGSAFLCETMMTFTLMYVVLECACNDVTAGNVKKRSVCNFCKRTSPVEVPL